MDPTLIPVIAILSVFVGFPIAIGASRWLWKRASGDGGIARRALTDDTAMRLERMQQSIDTMAIEIERISEGQRFLTKTLADRAPDALPRETRR